MAWCWVLGWGLSLRDDWPCDGDWAGAGTGDSRKSRDCRSQCCEETNGLEEVHGDVDFVEDENRGRSMRGIEKRGDL